MTDEFQKGRVVEIIAEREGLGIPVGTSAIVEKVEDDGTLTIRLEPLQNNVTANVLKSDVTGTIVMKRSGS